MEVHPPHHPLLTWRDFFVHIVTITIGLLIAIALEQTVEAVHHRHQRAEARENLRREIMQNREILAGDLKALAGEKKMLEADIAVLHELQARHIVAANGLIFNWRWNSMQDAAWQTARETAVLALFPAQQVEGYSLTYGQQASVNEAGVALSHAITSAAIPLTVQPNPSALTPAQVDELIRNCAAALNQMDYLAALTASLDPAYQSVLREF